MFTPVAPVHLKPASQEKSPAPADGGGQQGLPSDLPHPCMRSGRQFKALVMREHAIAGGLMQVQIKGGKWGGHLSPRARASTERAAGRPQGCRAPQMRTSGKTGWRCGSTAGRRGCLQVERQRALIDGQAASAAAAAAKLSRHACLAWGRNNKTP